MIPLVPRVSFFEKAAMMGRQTGDQASLFYEFRLEDRIPKEHLLRRIDVFMTSVLGGVRAQLQHYYSEIGRPSPERTFGVTGSKQKTRYQGDMRPSTKTA